MFTNGFFMSINSFLDYLTSEKKYSKHTITAYKNDLQSFKVFCESEYGNQPIEEVNYAQIRTWVVSLVEDKLSNRTINRKVSSLKSFYKYLQRTNQLKVNPLAKHQALKVSKKIQIPFSEKELVSVLEFNFEEENFENVRDKLIVELLYATGMRRNELVNLKFADVDLKSGVVKVKGKRNKERYIPLIRSVQESLNKYIRYREQLATVDVYLLLTKKGKKLYDTFVYRVINSYFSRVSSKVKKSPHIIRHSFATHLLDGGADLNSVKELLGHSSLASTQVYTHTSLGKLKKVYNQAHPRSKKTNLL